MINYNNLVCCIVILKNNGSHNDWFHLRNSPNWRNLEYEKWN